MKHNKYPADQENPKKGRVASKISALLGKNRQAQTHEQNVPKRLPVDGEYIDTLSENMRMSAEKFGVVPSGGRIEGSVKTSPIATRVVVGGSLELSKIIIAGNTAFGLVSKFQDQNGGFKRLAEATLVTLPFGANVSAQEGHAGSPIAELAKFDMSELATATVNGASQNWKEVTIGRNDPTEAHDEKMSRKHFSLTMNSDGGVFVNDHEALNGTYVIDGLTAGSVDGLQADSKQHYLNGMYAAVSENPFVWDPSLTGATVVPQ